MLVIRKQQVDEFDRAARYRFEQAMVEHLKQFAPRLFEIQGEAAFREVVRLGVDKAAAYGLATQGPVRLYIELMVMYGSHFDIDPLLGWAAEALNEPIIGDSLYRAEELYRRAVVYQKQVIGNGEIHLIEAMGNLSRACAEDYPGSTPGFEEAALEGLRAIYPEKCASAGEIALRALIRRGPERARHHAVATELGTILSIALPFLLGHGYDADPLYPWISDVLNDPKITGPEKRAQRLLNRSRIYLGEALAHLEQGK